MLSIHLHQLVFHAFHGLYEEEKILGNEFRVDLTVQHHPAVIPIHAINDTINYVALYELVKKRMEVPVLLLETLATSIAQDILLQFVLADTVNISITKLHPPISGFNGQVGVSFELNRDSGMSS